MCSPEHQGRLILVEGERVGRPFFVSVRIGCFACERKK